MPGQIPQSVVSSSVVVGGGGDFFVMLNVHKKHIRFFREGPSSSCCHPYYAFDSWPGVTSEEPILPGRVVTFANEEYFTDSELF